MTIAVIGAGASGMAAALQAAWKGAAVTLFEQNPAVGKKLLVTGSGRCNLTNDAVAPEKYSCADSAWLDAMLNQFGVSGLLTMLASIGIPAQKTPDGWYYPLSNSAQSVVEAFASALRQAGVKVMTLCRVNKLDTSPKSWVIHYIQKDQPTRLECSQVIVSAGGAAYPSLGSRGDLFPELARLGHTVLPNRPALAPLLADLGFLSALQGMRLNVGASLWKESQLLSMTSGNLIFTAWGINGPAVMDLSHHVSAHGGERLTLSLNLLVYVQEAFDQLLAQNRNGEMPLRIFLNAFFPPKVSQVYLKQARLNGEIPLCQVDDRALERLAHLLKDTRLAVKGVRGFEYCQVSAGGVPVNEVDPHTLESRRVNGLYLTGETLDVVGACGGYNLQFAFSSGVLAGRAAAARCQTGS